MAELDDNTLEGGVGEDGVAPVNSSAVSERDSSAGDDAVAGAAADTQPGQIPVPPPSAPAGLPTRDDIDFLRGSWQYTPAEINSYIDRQRPALMAAGFTPQEVDDYYGVERFEAESAAQQLIGAAKDAKQGVSPDVFSRVPTSPDYLLQASQSPEFFGQVLDMQTSPEARGLARQWLVHSYRIGACSQPQDFRQGILDTIADSGGAFDHGVNAWPGRMVSPATFEVMSRRALVGQPIVERIVRSSFIQRALQDHAGLDNGAATALTSALFDHDMPTSRDFTETATLSQFMGSGGSIQGMRTGTAENAPAPKETTAPDHWPIPQQQYFDEVGNTVKNLWRAYADYDITPFQILDRGTQYPALFTALKSPDADIRLFFPEETKYGPFSGGRDIFRGPEVAGGDDEEIPGEGVDGGEIQVLPIGTGAHLVKHGSRTVDLEEAGDLLSTEGEPVLALPGVLPGTAVGGPGEATEGPQKLEADAPLPVASGNSMEPVKGWGGRVLTSNEQEEFRAFGERAQRLGLKPSPYRTGSWGTYGQDGTYHEIARIDVGEAGQPGHSGKTHLHILKGKKHLPLSTQIPGETE